MVQFNDHLPLQTHIPALRPHVAAGKLEVPRLEHISLGLNRGDSQRFVNERVCRH